MTPEDRTSFGLVFGQAGTSSDIVVILNVSE